MSNSGPSTRRSSQQRRMHPPSMATATTQLLTATKALLGALNAWALQEQPVDEVSAKFVRFGDCFKVLRRSYNAVGLSTKDVADTPLKVRSILEQSLVLKPSQKSLDTFLPKIGEAVQEMMDMLQKKKDELVMLEEVKRKSQQGSIAGSVDSNVPILTVGDNGQTLDPDTSTASMTRLQHNSGLMRRASKRFSAYQTNSIINMRPESMGNSIASKSKLGPTLELGNSIDEEHEIEGKKELIQKRLSSSPPTSAAVITKETEIPEEKAQKETVLPTQVEKDTFEGKSHIYLKYKNDVKKVVIELPTSLANIKVLFAQKFNYSPPGASSFPKIYIQDPSSTNNVAYELEDLLDVIPNSVLSLHEPDLKSEIFRHVDSQIDSIKGDMIKMEDRIFKKLELISISTPNSMHKSTNGSSSVVASSDETYEKMMKKNLEARKNDQKLIEDLKFDLNKLKQHHERSTQTLKTSLETAMNTIVEIESEVVANQGMDNNSYMKQCKQKVSNGCEDLVIKLDDLQDIIEVLKLDITKRGAKPSHNQIQHISKEMKFTSKGLKDLMEFMTTDKKNWTALWSKTLNSIVEDQQFFKAQEEILSLLEQDYQSASETFDLIVKCVDELDKGAAVSRPMLPIPDPSITSEDATRMLFAEVESVNPNHEERVEAIRKLERVREMEKKIMMRNDFQDELGDFVESEKLKRNGGIEEMERKRKEKDESNLKNMFGVV